VASRGGILNEENAADYPLDRMLNGGRGRQKIVHLESSPDRYPPHSNDAEMAVLGAMMLEKEAASRAMQILAPDHFYRDTHKIIFQAMVSLADRNQPIDIITLNDELRKLGKLADVGGSHYLSELNRRTPSAANVEHHARIIFERALKRRLITAAQDIIENCYAESTDAFEELDHAEQKMFEIAESRSTGSYRAMKQLAMKTVDMLETIAQRYKEGGGVVGVPAGIVKLDSLTGGFQRSDMIIIAARPSMGKTGLGLSLLRNAAIDYKKAAAFFSLEMSAQQLVMRLISAEAKVDAHRLRTGDLKEEHWQRIASTIHRLADAPIYIDDSPALGIMELRARCRLMKREHNIELVVVDYLQLMHAPKAESREREISIISRGLKQLAKELDIPVIALAQLNRSVESRSDKRPMLSDLRESGCLTGDTLIPLADSGRRVPIRELIGNHSFAVWSMNPDTLQLERGLVSNAFSTGVKPVYRMTTRLGRTIRATGNHKFFTVDGWKRLDEIRSGQHVAVPRRLSNPEGRTMSDAELALLGHLIGDGCTLPRHSIQYTTRESDLAETVSRLAVEVFGDQVAPRIVAERKWYQVYLRSTRHHTHGVRSAVAEWLEELGAWGHRSHEKHVPERVFEQPVSAVATFLRHLWATDGCVRMRKGRQPYPAIYYASSSRELARDVQSLLIRCGINARIARLSQKGKGRDQYHVIVSGGDDVRRYAESIGAVGAYKLHALQEIRAFIESRSANTNRDIIPGAVWQRYVRPAMDLVGMTHRQLHREIGMAYSGMTLFDQNLSRSRASRIASVVRSEALMRMAESDVYWDAVVSIEPDGEEEVFDLTVPGPHNFVADDIIVHNSIEQDADVVMFVHRPEYYGITVDPEDNMPTEGIAELIIGKQRNGPTGTVKTAFIKEYARFENLAIQYDNAPQYLPPSSADEAPF